VLVVNWWMVQCCVVSVTEGSRDNGLDAVYRLG